jgi:hypothetical protein
MGLLRINLRDLFWAVLVVGLLLGWGLHYRQLQQANSRVDELFGNLERARTNQQKAANYYHRLEAAVLSEGYSIGAQKMDGPMYLYRRDQRGNRPAGGLELSR